MQRTPARLSVSRNRPPTAVFTIAVAKPPARSRCASAVASLPSGSLPLRSCSVPGRAKRSASTPEPRLTTATSQCMHPVRPSAMFRARNCAPCGCKSCVTTISRRFAPGSGATACRVASSHA